MIRPGGDPSQPIRRRRRALAAGILVVLAYAGSSLRRLDAPGRLYVLDAPLLGVAPRLVAPGWRLVPRGVARLADYPSGPEEIRADLSGERAAASREGARLEAEVDLTCEVPRDRVLDLHRARGPGYSAWLAAVAAGEATERLREAPYDAVRNRDPELARAVRSGVAEKAAAAGIRVTRLRIVQVAAPGETSAAILKTATPPLDRRVVLIGVDSFDWRIIEPLMRSGRMPNVARLVARGARFNLKTITPILSPVVWTSIATGVKPSRHGIADFVVAAPGTGGLIPVTSAMRQVPALWSLLSRQGTDVAVVGWWATWPAETVRGRIVSDRVAFQLFEDTARDDWKSDDPAQTRGKTYPPDLFASIRPLIRAPSEVGDAEVARFLPGGRFPDPAGLTGEERDRIRSFRTILAAEQTYHAIGLRLLDGDETRLALLYYEAPDTASHLFMRCQPPLLPGVPREEMERFSGVVDRVYEWVDGLIGETVARAGKDADIVLVSDHGFRSGESRPRDSDPRIGKGNAADWHAPIGVLVLAGPDVRAGVDLGSASVLDVAPTVLALYGLPAARDLDGQPLTRALDPGFLARHPVAWVDTYGGFRAPPEEAAASPGAGDTEVVERLRSLGYIGEDRMTAHNNRGVMALEEGDPDAAIAAFDRALGGGEEGGSMVRVNLAHAWLLKGDLARAEALASQVLETEPRNKQAESLLASVALKRADLAAAERHLERAIAIDPSFVPALSQLGRLREKQGEDAAALAIYRRVIAIAPLSPAELNAIGNIERRRGEGERAAEAWREAVRCDAQYFGAYNNLGLYLQEKGRLGEARALYDQGLAIRPENPTLRNSLGTLLALQGDSRGALAEFERAVRADPEWPVAQGNRATLLFEMERYREAGDAFERWMTIEPDSIEARLGLALTLLMLHRRDEAVGRFREVLDRDPKNVKAHIALGETLLRQGDLAGAQEHLEAAARAGGDIARVYRSLGEVYLARGLRREAAGAFRRSLALDPKQDDVRRRLEEAGG
jgi:tetratricopeptide (TPR) repeat protein